MNKSALESAPSSTNQAVAEEAETVIFLTHYEYLAVRGAFWPARAFRTKKAAEQYVNRINCTHPNRCYTVAPLILDGQ